MREDAAMYAYVKVQTAFQDIKKEANRNTSNVISFCLLQKVKCFFFFFNGYLFYDFPACMGMTKMLQDSAQRAHRSAALPFHDPMETLAEAL